VPSPTVASPASIEQSRADDQPVLPLVLLFLTLGALWFVLCKGLSAEWSDNEQYNYGWFVPFFALYLFWLRWEDRPGPSPARGQRSEVSGQRSAPSSLLPAPSSELPTPSSKACPERKSNGLQAPNHRGLIAAAIGIPALLLLLPVRLFEIGNPDWRPLSWVHAIVVVAVTLLAVWSVGGKSWLRHFAFPIGFFLVAVPWPSAIEVPIVEGLMRLVAAIASQAVNLFGIPAQFEGNLIRISNGLVGVNEACSGVRSLQTSLMIGLLFGELKRLSILRRVVLLCSAILIAFVGNCGRAFFLVWIAATKNIPAVDRWHDVAGYSIVAAVFVGSLALAALLGKKVESRMERVGGPRHRRAGQSAERSGESESKAKVENENASTSQHSDHSPATPKPSEGGSLVSSSYFLPSTFYLAAALCWLLLVELGTELWYRAHERNLRPSAQWRVRWPESSPGFRELKIPEGVRATLRYDEGREAVWRVDLNPSGTRSLGLPSGSLHCAMFFFRWQPGGSSVVRARAHRPDICLPSAGWRQISDPGFKDYFVADNFSVPFRHVSFAQNRTGIVAHTFFCLQEDKLHPTEPRPDLQTSGGIQPDWSFQGRSRVVFNGVRNLGQQVMECLLISSGEMDDSMAEQKFAELVRELVIPK